MNRPRFLPWDTEQFRPRFGQFGGATGRIGGLTGAAIYLPVPLIETKITTILHVALLPNFPSLTGQGQYV